MYRSRSGASSDSSLIVRYIALGAHRICGEDESRTPVVETVDGHAGAVCNLQVEVLLQLIHNHVRGIGVEKSKADI